MRAHRIVNYLLAVLVLLLVAIVFLNVAQRYVIGRSIGSSDELATVIFVWLCFLGAAVVAWTGGHMGYDSLIGRFPPPLQRGVRIVGEVIVAVMLAIVVWGAYALTVGNLNTRSPGTGLPLSALYFPVLLMAAVMLAKNVVNIVRLLRPRK